MGGPNRDSRDTVRFEPEQLAELTKQAEADVRDADSGEIARSRTSTVHDPLTTGLLAEASRRSQTIELDDDVIQDAARAPEDKVSAHVRRRSV